MVVKSGGVGRRLTDVLLVQAPHLAVTRNVCGEVKERVKKNILLTLNNVSKLILYVNLSNGIRCIMILFVLTNIFFILQ